MDELSAQKETCKNMSSVTTLIGNQCPFLLLMRLTKFLNFIGRSLAATAELDTTGALRRNDMSRRVVDKLLRYRKTLNLSSSIPSQEKLW